MAILLEEVADVSGTVRRAFEHKARPGCEGLELTRVWRLVQSLTAICGE